MKSRNEQDFHEVVFSLALLSWRNVVALHAIEMNRVSFLELLAAVRSGALK